MGQVTATNSTQPSAEQRKLVVEAAVREVAQIATLPEITLKIIRLVEDPDSTAADLHKIIANDPALSARVLKVVNSAFYALPGQIGSVNRAIVMLGLNAVKNIAIAASLAKLFRGGRLCPSFSARDLWQHCIAVGAATKMLSEKTKLGLPDEAFLAGLIHDIGLMVEMQARRPQLLEVVDRAHRETTPFCTIEQEVLGVDHQDFGRGLCQLWKFPNNLANVTGFHHRPLELDPQARPLTGLVHLGDYLAAHCAIGYARTVDDEQPEQQLCDELKLTSKMLDEVATALPDATEVAAQLLS